VRAKDSLGNWTPVASASAKTDPPPDPRAWVSHGSSAAGESGCGSGDCQWFKLTTKDFKAGTYSVTCYSETGKIGSGDYSRKLPANGSIELPCFYGYRGDQVWVTIDGKAYEKQTW